MPYTAEELLKLPLAELDPIAGLVVFAGEEGRQVITFRGIVYPGVAGRMHELGFQGATNVNVDPTRHQAWWWRDDFRGPTVEIINGSGAKASTIAAILALQAWHQGI